MGYVSPLQQASEDALMALRLVEALERVEPEATPLVLVVATTWEMLLPFDSHAHDDAVQHMPEAPAPDQVVASLDSSAQARSVRKYERTQ
jgi:hypothetical protein